ncbi:MAG: D-2-hydroxyacid dehydrogenase [Cyclobacteriaceae bacterium]
MNIAVLDGHTLNPGDLDWQAMERLGALSVYPRTAHEEVVPRAKNNEIVLVNKAILDEKNISLLPNLRFIAVMATGYNTVDLGACRKRDIVVSNVPGYGSPSVAQHTFALILALTNHVEQHHHHVSAGGWAKALDWSYSVTPLIELKSKTIGIIGLGQIGRKVARIAKGFDMQILAHTRSVINGLEGISAVDLDTVFKESDIVSLHCPLTNENQGMVNMEKLRSMKPSALLINTARGPLVNETDLAQALEEGIIAGAGLDVLSQEPPSPDHPLVGLSNCLITPHNAWGTLESRKRMMEILVQNIKAYSDGNPVNVVS